MAQVANTTQGNLVIPGAYGTFKVVTNPSGLATSGILVFVGEADQGPDYTGESTLDNTFFGPDEVSRATAKYGSGPLIDAMRIAGSAANDPAITGAPQGFYLIKTNAGGKASLALARSGLTNYGALYDQSFGQTGNLISAVFTEAPSEVAPTQTFAWIPSGAGSAIIDIRQNGGAVQTHTITAKTRPTDLVGAVTSGSTTGLYTITDILATGGVDRLVLTGFGDTDTLAVAASGNNVTLTLGGVVAAWGTTPSVGDTLIIPLNGDYGVTQDSCIKGAGSANVGQYIVTSATATTIAATKLKDQGVDTVTGPVAVVATAVGTEHDDILVYSPVAATAASGTSRPIFAAGNVGATITGVAAGSTLTLTLNTTNWNARPAINDYIYMPSSAPAAWHASGVNGGYYVVTASSPSTVTLTRLSNGAPASFGATAVAATTDLVCKRPAIDGTGKALEIYDGGGAEPLASEVYTLAGGAVNWISTAPSPKLTVSAQELEIQLVDARSSQNLTETIVTGGDILFMVGYKGTTATMTISGNTLSTTVTGGVGANTSINLKLYKTVGDLVAFINNLPGYTAAAYTNSTAQVALYDAPTAGHLVLDETTWGICSTHGNQPGRVKRDAWDFWNNLKTKSLLTQIGNPSTPALAGLPEAQSMAFLFGGSRGITTDAIVTNALLACEKLRANFIIPLISRDATADIADELTDTSSTYTLAATQAAVKSHVLKMSTFKVRRHRQGFVSIQDTFTNAINAANTMASFRVAVTFERFLSQGSNGTISTFQPWAGAVYAAAMQAAGFYRNITFKGINTSGVQAVDSSFDPESDTQVETALLNGLLPARRRSTGGGFIWVSDQTSYSVDSNFVYNSIGLVYNSDLVVLTAAQRMERAFVGQSLADVSAASAAGVFAAIMADLKRLKLLSASDDAPAGFKNLKVTIQGPVMNVSVEVKVTGAILFVPIDFAISEIQSAASA